MSAPDRLVDTVLTIVDADETISEEAKYLVLAALEGDVELAGALDGQYTPVQPTPDDSGPAVEPVGAFLKSITVSGFRGIGAEQTLHLHAAPGLTVVAGRNGSGKSTFAEALEVALTNNSYRWRERSAALFQRNWSNLHSPTPRRIRVAIAEEGVGTTTVGIDWPDETERFDDLRSWVQRPEKKREPGVDGLGWTHKIELYRPVLSYEELGGLLTAAPSKLYDALSGILGLERLAHAQPRLDTATKQAMEPIKHAKSTATELKKELAASSDERAKQALTQLRKHRVDLAALRQLAVGSGPAAVDVLAALRALADYELPDRATVDEVAVGLRVAITTVGAHADGSTERSSRRAALLRQAIELHDTHGTGHPCPVCGVGVLDQQWRADVDAELAAEDESARRLAAARRELDLRRDAAVRLIDSLAPLQPAPGVELAAFDRALTAVTAWRSRPADDLALAVHLVESTFDPVTELRTEAAAAWQARQDAWTPLATRIATYVELAECARAAEPTANRLTGASSWLRNRTEKLRNQQLEPLADEARRIWAVLRQESNVDLKTITLPKPSGNIRRVDIAAEVDGSDAGALGVMSTGELHALALALFLPRATRPESPFRFIVLDDPIQAMDPSKIDGFVTELARQSRTRQVVVFSHDDRLPEAVSRLAPDARVMQVSRQAGSAVTVDEAKDQARRDIEDALAVANDSHVPPEVLRRVLPRLCRSAVESATRDAYFARAYARGAGRDEVESSWDKARNQHHRIALALHLDADKSIDGWIKQKQYRKPAMDIIGKHNHQGFAGDPKRAIRDVEQLVVDIRALAR